DLFDQVARQLVVDSLLQLERLPDIALRRRFDWPGLEDFQGELTLDELALQHVDHRLQLEIAGAVQRNLGLPEIDRGTGVLEVVTGHDLPLRLVHGVDQLLPVELRDYVERIVLSHYFRPMLTRPFDSCLSLRRKET